MIKHGDPPYLECSSRGDKRLSAFYARIKSLDNKTIEEIFQAAKVLEDGSTGNPISVAKGQRATNARECSVIYSKLWDLYIEENPDLLETLQGASGLSDIFGQAGHVCQATELWRIRNSGPF